MSERNPRSASASEGRRNLLTNAAASSMSCVVQLVVAFFLSPFLLHGLGDQRYGIWSLVESVLGYLMLFDAGLGASIVRYVARFEAAEDRDQLNRLFSTCIAVFSGLGLVVFLLTLGLALGWSRPLGVPEELAADTRWLLLLLGANLGLQLPLGVYSSVLDGLGRYPCKNVIRTVALLVRAALFVLCLCQGWGLPALALATTLCNLVEYLSLAVAAKRYLPELRFSLRLVSGQTIRLIRGYSLDAFLLMFSNRVSFQTDAIVIGLCLAPQFITFFMLAARLVEYAKNMFRSAVTVLTPAVSALEARGDFPAIRRVLIRSTRFVCYLVLPVQLGFFFLGQPFLSLWVGPEYAERSYATLVILGLPMGLAIAQAVSSRILYGIGSIRWLARGALLQALANLLLSIALVGPYGIEGVAVGTVIPNAVYVAAVAVYICRVLHMRLTQYLADVFLKPILFAPIPAVIWLSAFQAGIVVDWLSFLAIGVLGVAAYAAPVAMAEIGMSVITARASQWMARLQSFLVR